jgi:serine/threonine-protein kinase RsbW
VELRLPADGVYVSVVRTTTAGLAARLDFLIDDIEDLRIAVGEACAMVLPEADLDSELVCSYYMCHPHSLTALSRETPSRLLQPRGSRTTTHRYAR